MIIKVIVIVRVIVIIMEAVRHLWRAAAPLSFIIKTLYKYNCNLPVY